MKPQRIGKEENNLYIGISWICFNSCLYVSYLIQFSEEQVVAGDSFWW